MQEAIRGSWRSWLALGASLGAVAFGCTESQPPPQAPTAVVANAPPSNPSPAPAPVDSAPQTALPDYRAIIDAPDRSPEDKALDAGRHPLELLKFLALRPGMK